MDNLDHVVYPRAVVEKIRLMLDEIQTKGRSSSRAIIEIDKELGAGKLVNYSEPKPIKKKEGKA